MTPGDRGSMLLPIMGCRVEFDSVNKILLLRVEGRLTDELLAEFYEAAQKYWAATDAKMGIADYSSVTEVVASTEFLRQLVDRKPVAAERPRIIVAPSAILFGLSRMVQITSERTRPLVKVVHSLDEAFAALGVQSPHFDPLE
jgi:hypothetical protein